VLVLIFVFDNKLIENFLIMDTFNSIANIRKFKKNETVFHIGQKADCIFRVIVGEVHLYRHSYDGNRILLYRAYDGDYLAEASLTSDSYHCSALCVKHSTIETYDTKIVKSILGKNPKAALEWIEYLSKELRNQRASVERLCLKSPVDKLIHYLITEGAPPGEYFISGTLSELAEILNISRETLYRTLSLMKKQDILKRTDGWLKLKK
jgi:CRP-like cAMP-binding protein